MDTEEMYERGTADAYRGEANPFYYQHYEPYRRAYNLTRRRVNKTGALPVVDVRRFGLNLAFVIAIVLVGLIIYWFATREIITPNKTKPTPVILPTLPAANVLVFATSTPVPSPSRSLAAPIGTAITGVRQAIASRIGKPKLSSREPNSQASHCA